MNNKRAAFTLVEVLISITLLSLVLMALYKSADILRDSNLHLFKHLEKSIHTLKGSKTLYMDLMHADHNITVTSEEKFHRLVISNTTHSLYGQGAAKVVWMVYKDENTLLRLEGGEYTIPLKNEERVEVDVIAKNIELFKIYKSKKNNKILAMIQIKGQEPQLFMAQNIPLAPPKPDVNATNLNEKGANNPNNNLVPANIPQ
ncbi:prepilin-type N-terminal cleavage/methylation domain-containing protein [bacterium]|nr:prepilin-type N-terminal cleavage/methylation domain-containing protein [bacterium]MBU1958409.1 prepilin-type N-terminal cleavage/methylation domain-containing protein [bacterium]